MIEEAGFSTHITWVDEPSLKAPALVAGFEGWSNAGSVSSDSLEYLSDTLQAGVCARLSNEPFTNFTADRPIAHIQDGILSNLEPVETTFTWASNPDGEHDLVFLLGKEPSLNWDMYARLVISVMRRLGVRRLYTIGGVQDTISHADPVKVSVVGSSAGAVADAVALGEGIEPADYYGPVSIHTRLIKACVESGIEAVSLWGHVPAYLQNNPLVVAKLVSIVDKASGMDCPVEELVRKSIELERKIDEILAQDPSLKQFVESIERKNRSGTTSRGDEKVIRLNDFSRRHPSKDSDQ